MAEPFIFESGETPTYMIELYTSEGCNSCPPAEERLNAIKENKRLWIDYFPLAFHVDYWNYLGWKDPYSKSTYSKRQRQYAKEGQLSRVYTPAFVVNGMEAGPRLKGVVKSNNPQGYLRAVLDNGKVTVSYEQEALGGEMITFHLAVLGMNLKSDITRGENRGRLAHHDFVVLSMQKETVSELQWQTSFARASEASDQAIVIWVSRVDSLVPLQVVGGYL